MMQRVFECLISNLAPNDWKIYVWQSNGPGYHIENNGHVHVYDTRISQEHLERWVIDMLMSNRIREITDDYIDMGL